MANRTLEGVHTALATLYGEMVAAGEPVVIVEGVRTEERQVWLYAAGRLDFDSDAHRKAWQRMGYPPFAWRPEEARVTWTLASKHLTGDALDIGLKADGGVTWKKRPYAELVKRWSVRAYSLGLENLGRAGDWLHWQRVKGASPVAQQVVNTPHSDVPWGRPDGLS